MPYIGEGNNLVPTIHVRDLSRLVTKIVTTKPEEKPYIIAVDRSENPTQKSIVEAISNGIGTGKVESIAPETILSDLQQVMSASARSADASWRRVLQLNLKIEPSPLMASEESDFDWHCQVKYTLLTSRQE